MRVLLFPGHCGARSGDHGRLLPPGELLDLRELQRDFHELPERVRDALREVPRRLRVALEVHSDRGARGGGAREAKDDPRTTGKEQPHPCELDVRKGHGSTVVWKCPYV